MHARLTSLHLVGILVGASALSGCSDPPPGKLFDENGAWSVVQYELGDGLEDIMAMTRKDAFLLSFDATNNVMTSAACGDEMSGFEPNNSTCRLSPGTTSWQCQCFSYAFQEDVMQMVEFAAGSPPPPVDFDPDLVPGQSGDTGSADTGDSTGGVDTGALTVLQVVPIPERMDTYDFRPLPQGVFGGNGASDHFIVEARSATLFNEVYEDPDGRGVCMPCVPGQGG